MTDWIMMDILSIGPFNDMMRSSMDINQGPPALETTNQLLKGLPVEGDPGRAVAVYQRREQGG